MWAHLLGLINFYFHFILRFANIAGLLNNLISTVTTLTWEPKYEETFINLKKALLSPPLLYYLLKNDQFVLSTDASDSSLGAVLSIAKATVIEYISRISLSAEKTYVTTGKECLAITWAIYMNNFCHYLIGTHFLLETDHNPLEWLIKHAKSSKSDLKSSLSSYIICNFWSFTTLTQ